MEKEHGFSFVWPSLFSSLLLFSSLFCYYLMKLGIWAKSECGAKSGFVSFWLVCGCEREAMVNTQNTHTHACSHLNKMHKQLFDG